MELTLMSTTQITDAGFTVNFKSKLCKIIGLLLEHQHLATIPQIGGLYTIAASVQHQVHIANVLVSDLHRALGHVAQPAVIDTVWNGLIGGVELFL
jgi:hypothetical protein